ncbi:histone-lysine n-methyltransferase [Anopheles sinensis]|uniref:Histone-lysine n-methyltransferase n=1 Tax=Anopheles sinensis TaxID=74873 RepID=A0A084W5Y3_ANOSI|nr:histone-lysine n-methyltransferase [Anopheles sinensis]
MDSDAKSSAVSSSGEKSACNEDITQNPDEVIGDPSNSKDEEISISLPTNETVELEMIPTTDVDSATCKDPESMAMCDAQGPDMEQPAEESGIEGEIRATEELNVPVSEDLAAQCSQQEEKINPMETDEALNYAHAKCSNPVCDSKSREMLLAPLFALNVYEIRRKKKHMFICRPCFDEAIHQFEIQARLVADGRPLYSVDVPRLNELVEICDSSDEETESQPDSEQNDTALPADIVALVEAELEDVLQSSFKKYNLEQQIAWSLEINNKKLTRIQEEFEKFTLEAAALRKGFDGIQNRIGSCVHIQEKKLPEYIINDFHAFSKVHPSTVGHKPGTLGEVERKPIQVDNIYFGLQGSLMGSWAECKVVQEVLDVTTNEKKGYLVQFLKGEGTRVVLNAKQLAYSTSTNVKIPQGNRVIAKTARREEDLDVEHDETAFYAGFVAESLHQYNSHRYLIIFDNGRTCYAHSWNVRLVCEQSEHVWEDMDPHVQEFVRDYMHDYKQYRPMVQVRKDQRLMTERGGKWRRTVVLEVDCSLVKLLFTELNKVEWMFRGSKRLAPMYKGRKRDWQQISKVQKLNIPSIEYITIDDDDDDEEQEAAGDGGRENTANNAQSTGEESGVAKSAAMVPTSPVASPAKGGGAGISSPPDSKAGLAHLTNILTPGGSSAKKGVPGAGRMNVRTPHKPIMMNKNVIYCDDRPQGKTHLYTTKNYRGPEKYRPHECNPKCLFPLTFDLKTYNLLARPLICGWERQICKARGKRTKAVVYRAPCGRRLRYIYELHSYLRTTKSSLNVEHFDFDPDIRALATFKALDPIYDLRDLSCGKEQMPVSCVNCFDDTKPPPCEYSAQRIPTEGVFLNLDEDFLSCCDCEDDCFDKNRCQCWQLTVQGALENNVTADVENIGYVYKRLEEVLRSGIFECNSRCKCKVNECLNRVVQHPLQTKLQVFRTSDRGWGIRCLNDIPNGSFVCIYAGLLLTEEASNQICKQDPTGDEYFAELDYIETIEHEKEGYESDELEMTESESEPDTESEPETFVNTKAKSRPTTRAVTTRSTTKNDKSGDAKGNKKSGAAGREAKSSPVPAKPKRLRQLYGKNEQIYVMDAKKTGNLGRYFNHSCVPNLVVQNVFVDTHDPRFPWVAFFAKGNIKAGEELTWNYAYDVGSVPGKVLFCNCGERECRKRIL